MWAAATGTFSAGGSPTSKVRGRSWEEGPHAREEAAKRSYPTSEVGAAVESARLRRYRNGQEATITRFITNDIVQETEIKTIPKKKKCKKAKWLSEEALQTAMKRREVKDKGENKRYTI